MPSSTRWLKLLAGSEVQRFVVGDDDQSIYRFRGARVENMQHFQRDFPQAQLFRLEQNYRSTSTILGGANALIAHNSGRLGKNLWTSGAKGDPIRVYAGFNERDEAEFVLNRIRDHVQHGGLAARDRDSVSLQCAVACVRGSAFCRRVFRTGSMAA